MDLLRPKNELTAVGNARVNARGDELGPGGKIEPKKRRCIRRLLFRYINPHLMRQSFQGNPEVEHKADAVEEEIAEAVPRRKR